MGQLSTKGQRVAWSLFDTRVPITTRGATPMPMELPDDHAARHTSSRAWNALREQYLVQIKESIEGEFHTWTRTLSHMRLDIFTTAAALPAVRLYV